MCFKLFYFVIDCHIDGFLFYGIIRRKKVYMVLYLIN